MAEQSQLSRLCLLIAEVFFSPVVLRSGQQRAVEKFDISRKSDLHLQFRDRKMLERLELQTVWETFSTQSNG